jgi:hypothetical protein
MQARAISRISSEIYSSLRLNIPTGRDIEEHSLALDGIHANGYKEIDMNSLYGTMQVRATHEWF